MPLIGLAITVWMNSAARGLGLGLLGGVIFIIGILAGWIVTSIVAVQYFTGRGRAGNLIGGFVTNSVLSLFVAVSFHAVFLARQAAIETDRREAAELEPPVGDSGELREDQAP